MPAKMIGNEYRTTMLCIDSFHSGQISGRICNPYLPEAEQFDSLMQMLLKLDSLLDNMRFPQSFSAKREFYPIPTMTVEGKTPDSREGKRATFAVRILFRQNASWQGSVVWLEEGREESFRSALELIFLMNSALKNETS